MICKHQKNPKNPDGDVVSFRRCLHANSTIENGTHTARMRLRSDIPSYIRIISETLLIIYDHQPRTCRRCNRTGHIALECSSYACFNCDELGHVASDCPDHGAALYVSLLLTKPMLALLL